MSKQKIFSELKAYGIPRSRRIHDYERAKAIIDGICRKEQTGDNYLRYITWAAEWVGV